MQLDGQRIQRWSQAWWISQGQNVACVVFSKRLGILFGKLTASKICIDTAFKDTRSQDHHWGLWWDHHWEHLCHNKLFSWERLALVPDTLPSPSQLGPNKGSPPQKTTTGTLQTTFYSTDRVQSSKQEKRRLCINYNNNRENCEWTVEDLVVDNRSEETPWE